MPAHTKAVNAILRCVGERLHGLQCVLQKGAQPDLTKQGCGTAYKERRRMRRMRRRASWSPSSGPLGASALAILVSKGRLACCVADGKVVLHALCSVLQGRRVVQAVWQGRHQR